jgi:hypothetical protein
MAAIRELETGRRPALPGHSRGTTRRTKGGCGLAGAARGQTGSAEFENRNSNTNENDLQ